MSAARRRGSALVVVILALALLLSLGVPFLLAGRLRSESAQESFDRVRARLAAGSATRYALHREASSHPALDPDPWWDAPAEWDPAAAGVLPQALGGGWTETGESWGFETEAAQGRVSLASAAPVLLQNLLHPCFVSEDTDYRAAELPVTSTAGFPDSGLLLIAGSWVEYRSKDARSFLELSPAAEEATPDDLASTRFREGTAVLDPRVWNLALARLRWGEQRPPEVPADLFELDVLGVGALPAADRERLLALCWFWTGSYGSGAWGPGTWLLRDIDPERPERAVVADPLGFGEGSVARFEPVAADRYDALLLASGSGRGGVGALVASAPLPFDLAPFTTQVRPLLREPVDLNSAPPEVIAALVVGLRWTHFVPWPGGTEARVLSGNLGRDWVSPAQAREFAARVAAARPLRGPDDLWARVLRPLEDEGALTGVEALAIHLNGLQAGSGELAQSTAPFGYRTGDRYLQRVNAAVRSRLGSTLARRSERQVVAAAPSGAALRLWRTQRDFDEEGLWGRGYHGVISLPNSVGFPGGKHDPPFALGLRTGASLLSGVLAPDRLHEEEGFLIPCPARETDEYGPGTVGRTEHFDWERSPLGYDVLERGPLQTFAFEWNLVGQNGVYSEVEPLHLQGWFEMPPGLGNATLFDFAGPTTDGNRVYAALEDGKLVVKGFDPAGDDPLDPDGLEQAVRVEIDPAEYPFQERWMHLSVLLRGIHPRGLQVALDGVPRGRVNCLTYTTGAVSGFAPGDVDGDIAVESTDGFPARGAIRIGDEVIEYSSKTAGSFVLDRASGADGYFGGRVARESSDTLIASQDSSHPAGAAVELYGYSAILAAPLPPGGGSLSGDFGPWSMAHPIGGTDTITVLSLLGRPIEIGTGYAADWLGELQLEPTEPDDPYYAEAFQSDGGYALLFQRRPGWIDQDGARVGGWEIVRYSQRQDDRLSIIQRNVISPGLERAPDGMVSGAGNSFIAVWNPNIVDGDGEPLAEQADWRVLVFPLSVKGAGVSDLAYPLPDEDHSEFVQICTPGDSTLTEWVRYDSIVDNAFLRDDPGALLYATQYWVTEEDLEPPEEPGGGGFRPPWQEPGQDTYQFVRTIGEPVDDRNSTIQGVYLNFGFRGVMYTSDHAQARGARLVPVGRTLRQFGPWGGYVGRFDRVAAIDPQSGGAATFWFTVEWAAAPPVEDGRLHPNQTYWAFTDSPYVALAATDLANVDLSNVNFDPRATARLVKFPSGERPLQLESLAAGGDVSGGGAVFPGRIDELAVHTVAGMGQPQSHLARCAFVLDQDLDALETQALRLHEFAVQLGTSRKFSQNAGDWFAALADSGLLDLDGERIAYSAIDRGTGELTLAPGGRGLHGTEPRGHAAGTTAWVVDGRAAAALSSDIAAGDPLVPLDRLSGFPPRPLLLIDRELIHAPLRGIGGNEFLMPLRRPDPLRQRDGGDGILRGRFGTAPAGHAAGTLVYSMPLRWEDRYVPESDSPAAAWYEIGLEEPGAWWRGVRFEAEVLDSSHKVRILARAGPASWEDPPAASTGLVLIEEGARNGLPVPLGLRADRLDLRLSFDWDAGAFDPVDFLSFGWVQAPRVSEILIDYLVEPRVESAMEVRE